MTEESDLTCSTVRSWELESRIWEGALCNRNRSRRRPRPRPRLRRVVYVPANVERRLDQTAPAPPFEDEDDYEARILLDPSSWILAPGSSKRKVVARNCYPSEY